MFARVDCNSFYPSCERVFNPRKWDDGYRCRTTQGAADPLASERQTGADSLIKNYVIAAMGLGHHPLPPQLKSPVRRFALRGGREAREAARPGRPPAHFKPVCLRSSNSQSTNVWPEFIGSDLHEPQSFANSRKPASCWKHL